MKITITRALTELKTLKSRISNGTMELSPFAVQRGNLLVGNSAVKPEDFSKKADAEIKSLQSLLERQFLIKSQIDKSNAQTIVKVGGRDMTIQEVLIRKSFLDEKFQLYTTLTRQYTKAKSVMEIALKENENCVNDMVRRQQEQSGTKGDRKEKEDLIEQFSQMVEKNYPITLLDPTKAVDYIETLKKEIDEFNQEVDYVLSESNSTTFIELPD